MKTIIIIEKDHKQNNNHDSIYGYIEKKVVNGVERTSFEWKNESNNKKKKRKKNGIRKRNEEKKAYKHTTTKPNI